MLVENFHPPSLRKVYSEPYSPRMLEWRRLGALDKARHIQNLLGGEKLSDVLEVGCGTGDVLVNLAKAGFAERLCGIEIGETRLETSLNLPPSVEVSYYDGKRIGFADHTFDLVYATHVLEHVVDERSFLAELRRVTRRYVYVEVPLEIHARSSWRSMNKSLQIGHINAYDTRSFVLKLETSGLRVLRAELFDHSFAVHRFTANFPKAIARAVARRLTLGMGIGHHLFTFHCGALCEPTNRLDID